jgi:aspartate/methionine/tyrosine aminotransferase
MNDLARELNTVLDNTVIGGMLSELGRSFYFPKGIVAQTAEAKKHANRFNATVGMAFNKGKPLYLPSIREELPSLDPERIFTYVTTTGDPELRELWMKEILRKNPDLSGKKTSLPLVVSGITHGLSLIADLFADTGDAVIIPDMYWGNYRLIFELRRKARIVTYPFFNSNNKFNLQALCDAIKEQDSRGRILIILNFPNNPTGYTPSGREAVKIASSLSDLAGQGIKMNVATDDAYFGLCYEDESYKQSLFSLLAGLHDNILAVKLDGATKEELAWGFRIGFLTFACPQLTDEHYEALIRKTMGLIRSSVSNASRPAQSLLVKALQHGSHQKEKERVFAIMRDRYRSVRKILSGGHMPANLQPLPFNSGYFMCFKLTKGNSEMLRQKLLHEKGIGTISIEGRYLRITYSLIDREDLNELFEAVFETAGKLT